MSSLAQVTKILETTKNVTKIDWRIWPLYRKQQNRNHWKWHRSIQISLVEEKKNLKSLKMAQDLFTDKGEWKIQKRNV